MKTSNQTCNAVIQSPSALGRHAATNPNGAKFFVWMALLAGLLCFGALSARAHQEPPGCTGSGLGILLFTSSPDVHIGDTLIYGITVFNGTGTGPVVCNAEAIRAFVVTPDGITNNITLVRTNLSNGQGDYYPNAATYVVRAQDIRPDGTVRATANDTGIIHQNDTDSIGGGFQGVNTEVSQPCIGITAQCVGGVGENGAITFTGTVTNCGNNTLVSVTVTNNVNGGQFHVTVIGTLTNHQSATFSGSWVPLNPCSPSTATLVASGTDQFTSAPRTVTASANTTCQNTLATGIKVTKACPVQPVAPGQLLTFSGSVSNTGNVTLTNVIVVDNQPVANTVVFTSPTLAPGQLINFTGSYLAPTNCSVTDTLNATATSVCGVGVSSVASATCPILTTPQIAVNVSCPVIPAASGGTLTYSGTVQNTGNTTLSNIVVIRDFPITNTTVFTQAVLTPGASANFTSSVTVPAGACSVTTTFSGRGKDNCTVNLVTNNVTVSCPITTTPAILVTLACPVVSTATGGVITYTGTVRNTGNVILNNVTVVNDQSNPALVFSVASLAPNAVSSFTASFTTPADACSVSSTVTASGNDNCSQTPVNNSASATCTLTTAPRLIVTQTCPVTPASLGGLLTYGGTVSNAGNITLTNVVLTSDRTGTNAVFTIAALAPGVITNFTGSYLVPTNAGCSVTAILTANGRNKCTGVLVTTNVTTSCPVLGAANISVTLACPLTPTALGGVLTFSGNVRNNGTITLTNVVVTRNVPGPNAVVFTAATLAAGASNNFTGSYTVPSSNACSTTTSVSATANEQCAGAGVAASTSIDCPLVTSASIVVRQTCPVIAVAPGGLMTYSGTVSNAGNITLTNVTVVNSQPVPNTVVYSGGTLAPGATASFNSFITAPLDACSASSTLIGTGQNQCNGTTVSNSTTTTCTLLTAPNISVTKACPVIPVTEGGLLVFTGTVTNTGNITLTNVIVVNNRPTSNTVVFGPLTLAPGAGTNFSGSYTAPLNTCSITDTLTATGRDKCTGSTVTNFVSATCPIITIPRIAVTLACPTVPGITGGLVTYTGTVRNAGNVTLNNVVVSNSQSQVTVLIVPSLAPGVISNFTTTVIAPADACSVTTTVIASGNDACSQAGVSTNATTTCALVTTPLLVVTQTCPASPSSPGGLLTYSGTVSNAGNITLTNVLVTNDRTGVTPVFSLATLAPGVSASFTGSYTVPTNGGCSVTSMLTGSGYDKCTGVRVFANASSTCPLLTAPNIVVTQTCPVNPVAPGGILTYSGTVSNAGNITLTNVVVVNNHPASNTVIFTIATLAPGARTNFTGSYVVPLNCCVVSSTVGATGHDICTGATVTDTFTATCTVLTVPQLVVTKVCPPTATRPGLVLQYSGSVSNSGNITLINVTLVNTQPGTGSPVWGPLTLAPGESVAYYGSYLVVPDFCGTDTVTAQGLDACTFTPVVNSVTTTCPILTTPRIAVTKSCPQEITPRGGVFTFTGTVSNPGDVTLTNVMVVNNYQLDCYSRTNGPVIGPITLAPGATVGFSGSYIAPWSCCEVVDTLTASGQDRCGSTRVTSTATAICPLLSTPAIAVTKICPPTNVPAGGLYTYTGSVSNAGDVVLTNVFVVASQPNANTSLLGPIELAPHETKSFSGSYIVAANSNPATATVTASGKDTCQGRTVTATSDCSGPVGQFRITSFTLTNTIATVTWTATAGTNYTLQFKTNLPDLNWFSAPGDVTAITNSASKTDAVGTNSQRFYRVKVATGL